MSEQKYVRNMKELEKWRKKIENPTKKDFELGTLIFKGNKPFGFYVREVEGERLGIYMHNEKKEVILDLETQQIEDVKK